jgi:macrodomain Ter protein organizer (MatP/YcbG family)
MSGFLRQAPSPADRPAVSAAELLRRRPQRVTITLSWQVRQRLQGRADTEGRSLSNLMAYLLEQALESPNSVT